jgi:hypothetical protein
MTSSATGLDPTSAFAVRVRKLAQDQAKPQGEQAVALGERTPRRPARGEWSHVNTLRDAAG